jgi:hypothetical protein
MIYTEKESNAMHELIGAVRAFVRLSDDPQTAYMRQLIETIDAERGQPRRIPTLNGPEADHEAVVGGAISEFIQE